MHRILTCLVVVTASLGAHVAWSAPITADDVRVIDGDTIRLHQQKPDVRLVGFNAPETRRAVCEAERELGGKATARLRDLVRSSKLDFQFVLVPARQEQKGHRLVIMDVVAAFSKPMGMTLA